MGRLQIDAPKSGCSILSSGLHIIEKQYVSSHSFSPFPFSTILTTALQSCPIVSISGARLWRVRWKPLLDGYFCRHSSKSMKKDLPLFIPCGSRLHIILGPLGNYIVATSAVALDRDSNYRKCTGPIHMRLPEAPRRNTPNNLRAPTCSDWAGAIRP